MPAVSEREKKQWQEEALKKEFKNYLQHSDKMLEALIEHELIYKLPSEIPLNKSMYNFLTADDFLKSVLKSIDNNDEKPSYRINRNKIVLGNTLIEKIKIKEEDLKNFKNSDILQIEVALFKAVKTIMKNHSENMTNRNAHKAAEIAPLTTEDILYSLLKPEVNHLLSYLLSYFRAKTKLENAIEKQEYIPLKQAAGNLVKEAEQLKLKSSLPIEDITETLNLAYSVMTDLTQDNIEECEKQSVKLSKFPAAKTMANVLLGLTGVALILLSVGATGLSLGLSAPLSIAGIVTGAAMVAASMGMETSLLSDFTKKNKLGKSLGAIAQQQSIIFNSNKITESDTDNSNATPRPKSGG